MNKKLEKAADKMAKAYRAWIMSNAAYNSLLSPGNVNTYTIKWDSVKLKDVKK